MLRLRQDGTVEWRYVNRASNGQVYLLNWSRYIAPEEGAQIANRLKSFDCGVNHEESR
jgi:hypothetical protein